MTSKVKVYICGFNSWEQRLLPDGFEWKVITGADEVVSPRNSLVIVHHRVHLLFNPTGLNALLYIPHGASWVPVDIIKQYRIAVNDMESGLLHAVTCPERFNIPRQLFQALDADWLAASREIFAKLDLSAMPIDFDQVDREDVAHVHGCADCREELDFLTTL